MIHVITLILQTTQHTQQSRLQYALVSALCHTDCSLVNYVHELAAPRNAPENVIFLADKLWTILVIQT